ncbi:YkgJ family cysteine cluster protein [Patescibacteria group bacterium]
MNKIRVKKGKINWKCLEEKCPQSCCASFKTNKSRSSLWQVGEDLLPLTPKDYQFMVKNSFKKYLVQKKDSGWYIKSNKDGSCPFLKENKCSIYHTGRVSTCRSYPFFFSKYNGLFADFTCPGWGKGWTSMKKVKEMVKELIKLYNWQIKKAEKKLNLAASIR